MYLLKPAFLFDIDGCLTLPFDPTHPVSVLDQNLIQLIYDWSKEGIDLALVTGRSSFYLEDEFRKIGFSHGFDLPIYIEFGLLRFHQEKLVRVDYPKNFDNEREGFLRAFRDLAEENGYPMEDGAHVDYPVSGAMWREKKHVMSSVISNTKVTPKIIHDLSRMVFESSEYNIRLLNHPLGIDILPEGWSKREAAYHFKSIVGEERMWFVFGDNRSDEEMTEALENSEFTSTRDSGSPAVWRKLRELAPKFGINLYEIDQRR